jgi:mannose-6-phosphate isomerase-like protein (cupin superfamily)
MIINIDELAKEIKNFKINLKEEDLLNLLRNRKRWPIRYPWGQPSIEIIDNLNKGTVSGFFNADNYIDFDKWHQSYEKGFTSILSNVLDLNNDLRKINKLLNDKIGKDINANFYLSRGGQAPSFLSHTHEYPVIVKQIYGTGYWKINNKELILKPQEVVVLPKNSSHQVYKVLDKKLSLTINIA